MPYAHWVERFERFRFSVLAILLGKGGLGVPVFQCSLAEFRFSIPETVWPFRFRLWFLEKRFRQFRFPVQARLRGTQRGARQRGAQANASRRKQIQTNVDYCEQTQRRECKDRQAKVSKRGQMQTNAYTPLHCSFLHPPFAIPLLVPGPPSHSYGWSLLSALNQKRQKYPRLLLETRTEPKKKLEPLRTSSRSFFCHAFLGKYGRKRQIESKN